MRTFTNTKGQVFHGAVTYDFYGEDKKKLGTEKLPFWLIAGLNRPKNRGKKGKRRNGTKT